MILSEKTQNIKDINSFLFSFAYNKLYKTHPKRIDKNRLFSTYNGIKKRPKASVGVNEVSNQNSDRNQAMEPDPRFRSGFLQKIGSRKSDEHFGDHK